MDEIAWAMMKMPTANTACSEKPISASDTCTRNWARTMSNTWLTPLLPTLTLSGT
ncbi:hypothetical protein [Lysobacter capsici]|uniref:hypothetical protein n=1 Tax=Lysobacter capsici TaxID=435897 RepID=UPI00398CB30A